MRAGNTGLRLAGLALAWLLGVGIQLGQVRVFDAWWCVPLASAALALVVIGVRRSRVFVLALLGMALLGFSSAAWRAVQGLEQGLHPRLEGVDLRVTGIVASLPQRSAGGQRFHFEVEGARRGSEAVRIPAMLAVGWYAGFHDDTPWPQDLKDLRAGQRWELSLRLKQVHGLMNPHGFDQELHLFEQGIRATAAVRDAPGPRLIDRAAGHPVQRLRQHVRDAIDLQIADRRVAGVLAALSVGDQSAIDREDWQVFRDTGVAHLMSISGLHVTMFAWLAGSLVAALWRRHDRACAVLPAVTAGRWLGLAAAAAYAVFSGWGIPAQRTVCMLGTVTLLQTAGRPWPWPLVLLAAAVTVSAADPWALLQPGFWLSFMAVALLMSSGDAHRHQSSPAPEMGMGTPGARGARTMERLRSELRSQVVATVGLAPLSLVFFQQVSVVGFVANLVAIPLVTLVITPLALLGAIAWPLWTAAAAVVRSLAGALAGLAGLPMAVWSAPVAPGWAQCAGLAGAALLVMPLPWRLRGLSVLLLLPLFLPGVPRPAHGEFELVAADVGQGTAVLVRTRNRLLLYDAGPQYAPQLDAGERVLLPLLRARGETVVDRLVLSHRDIDHVGGAARLLAGVDVLASSSSLEDGHPLLPSLGQHTRCVAGQAWDWDGVRFEVLHPPAEAYGENRKPNGLSCVVRVAGSAGSALMAGDIERDQEQWLTVRYGTALKSDVLVVPHHGSKTSSTPAFLDAVAPRAAVFQAGYRNRFGHPAPAVKARYEERRIATMDSASCGAWWWHSREAVLTRAPALATPAEDDASPAMGQGVCQRDAARRYWHHGSHGLVSP